MRQDDSWQGDTAKGKEGGCKSVKKGSSDDSGSSGRLRSKHKPEEYKKKITDYMCKPNASAAGQQANNLQKSEKKKSSDVEQQQMKRIAELEEKVKEKDRLIAQLRSRKQEEEQKASSTSFHLKEYKKQAKKVIAAYILEIAHAKRQELQKIKRHTQVQVEMAELRKVISRKEAEISRLSKAKPSDPDECTRNTCCMEFCKRELQELRREMEFKEKECINCKERSSLLEKEKKSAFFKANWPIIHDKYQPLSLLGLGGYGEVYKCFDFETNQYVALKVIDLTEKVKDSEERRAIMEKLKNQYAIQQQLKHCNIVKFHNLIESSDKIIFELEYCNGIELSVYMRKYRCIEETEAKAIIRQLFSVLNYFFGLKEKVIHFDLKPSNIMLCEGTVKLLDFGLSKLMPDNDDTKMELTSQGPGTLWYLPPETFHEQPMASCKVDVWSAGVIFYELLYGRKPFCHGIPQQEIFNQKLILSAKKVEFPSCSPQGRKISKQAMQFIELCLKYDPHERPNPAEAYSHHYLQPK